MRKYRMKRNPTGRFLKNTVQIRILENSTDSYNKYRLLANPHY